MVICKTNGNGNIHFGNQSFSQRLPLFQYPFSLDFFHPTWTSTRGRLGRPWRTIRLLAKDFTQCRLDHHYIKLSVSFLEPVLWRPSHVRLTGGAGATVSTDFSRIHAVRWRDKHVDSVCEKGEKHFRPELHAIYHSAAVQLSINESQTAQPHFYSPKV